MVLCDIGHIDGTNAILLDADLGIGEAAQDRPADARRETGGGSARRGEEQVSEALPGACSDLVAGDSRQRREGWLAAVAGGANDGAVVAAMVSQVDQE